MNSFNQIEYKIRKVRIDDASDLYELKKTVWLSTYPNAELNISKKNILQKFENKESYIKKLEDQIRSHGKKSQEWVAELDNKIIGVAGVYNNRGKNSLGAIYILPQYQNLGIGTRLLSEVFSFYKNSKEIWLEVTSYNKKAIEFYEKHGFKKVSGSTSSYKLTKEISIPVIEMVLEK